MSDDYTFGLQNPRPQDATVTNEGLAWDSRVPRNVSCHPGGDDCIGGSSEVYWVYLSSMFPAYQVDLEIGCGSMKMLFGTICSLHQHGSLSAWSNMLLQIFMFLVSCFSQLRFPTGPNITAVHFMISSFKGEALIPQASQPVFREKQWPVMRQGILWDTFGWMFQKEMTHG